MSDPYVVLVTIDFAPWDSDSVAEPRLYEFSGPGEAQAFRDAAEPFTDDTDMNIGVYDPTPVERFGNAEDALANLKEWISEAE